MLSDIASIANYYSPLITAIATVVLAIITAYYAWQNRKYVKLIEKERKEKISREIIDKAYNPLRKQIESVTKLQGISPIEFTVLRNLENQHPSLIYNIPDNLRKSLYEFSNLYNNVYLKEFWKLMLILDKTYRKVLPKFGISSRHLENFKNLISVNIHFEKPVRGFGSSQAFNLLYFIFEQNFSNFLKEYLHPLTLESIDIVVFEVVRYGGGYNPRKFTLKVEDVERLVETVKNELRNNEKFLKVSEIREEVKNKANKLNKEIKREIECLSKNLRL